MFVYCQRCVFSGRGLCDEPTTGPEGSYRLWCVVLWSRNLVNKEALAHWGLSRQKQNKISIVLVLVVSYVGVRYALNIKRHKAIKYVTIYMAWDFTISGRWL
jgi:hypothetical protein